MFFISSKNNIKPETLLYYIVDAEKSIVKQARYDEKRLQKDGWGFGYISEDIHIYKNPSPIYETTDILKEKIKNIETNSFIIHVRRASNPRKLPLKKLISLENTQPFYADGIIFTHNGTLNIVDEIYENLGRYKRFVKGQNDSEVLFWHLMKNIEAYGDVSEGIFAARREINTVWISVKKNYKNFSEPYTGLNIFVYQKEKFYALCDFKLKDEKGSLMSKGWKYGDYAIYKDSDIFVISSEPLDEKNWQRVCYNSFVEFDIKRFRLKLTRTKE